MRCLKTLAAFILAVSPTLTAAAGQDQVTTLTTNYTILWQDVAAHKNIQTNKNTNSIDLQNDDDKVSLWPATLPADARTCDLADNAVFSTKIGPKEPENTDRYIRWDNGLWLSGLIVNKRIASAKDQAEYIHSFLGRGTTIKFTGQWIELCGVSCKDGKLTISDKGLEFARGTLLKR